MTTPTDYAAVIPPVGDPPSPRGSGKTPPVGDPPSPSVPRPANVGGPTVIDADATCPTCEYAREHACWPPGFRGTHCADSRRAGVTGCHRSWTSTREAHCTVCHGQFASNGVADRHWKDSRHVDPVAVAGLVLGDDGVWHGELSDRDRLRLQAMRDLAPQTVQVSPTTGVPS